MAMAVHWCHTERIYRCSMTRALPEATGRRHWATTGSTLPAAAGAPANETTMQHVPTLLAISMALAMRRYNTVHIAQWKRFLAFKKATKRHHRASTRSDITKPDMLRQLFRTFHREKELQLTC